MSGGIGDRDVAGVPAFALQSDCPGGEFAGSERVVNPLACERLDNPGGVACKKERWLRSRNRFARQRRNRSPGMIRRNSKASFGPGPEGSDLLRHTHQT